MPPLPHSLPLSEGTEERSCLQTAAKVSRGLGQRCATRSVNADRDGGTEDGEEWRRVSRTLGAPVGDDAETEGQ